MSLKNFSAKVHSNPRYAEIGAPVTSSYAVNILFKDFLLANKECSCLEIGFGRGQAMKAIEKIIETRPKGIDINPQLVERLKSEGYDVACANMDDGLPFADQSFDIVYSDQVLEHVESPLFFLDEVNRVLKPNGHLLLGVPNVEYKIESAYYNPVHFNYFSKKSLSYTLKAMGFDVQSVDDQRSLIGWKRFIQSLFKFQGGAIYAHAVCNKDVLAEKKKQVPLDLT